MNAIMMTTRLNGNLLLYSLLRSSAHLCVYKQSVVFSSHVKSNRQLMMMRIGNLMPMT